MIIVIAIGSISMGQCLPNLEGIATAGGSADAIFEVIDSVSAYEVYDSTLKGQPSGAFSNILITQ